MLDNNGNGNNGIAPENGEHENENLTEKLSDYNETTRRSDIHANNGHETVLEVEEKKSKYLKSKATADGIEDKLKGSKSDPRNAVIESLKKAVNIYNGQISAPKKFIYDAALAIGVNLYQTEINRHIKKARRIAEAVHANNESLEEKIGGEDNQNSLAEQVKQKDLLLKSLADNIKDNQELIAAYDTEIMKKERELKSFKAESKGSLSEDQSSDLAYLQNELTKLKSSQKDLYIGLRRSNNRIKTVDAQLDCDKIKLIGAENVSNTNLEVYLNCLTQIENVEALISTGDSGKSYSEMLKTAGTAVKQAKAMQKIGNVLGYAINDTMTQIITQSEQIKKQSEGQPGYIGTMELTKTKSQIAVDSSVEMILRKVIPERYK